MITAIYARYSSDLQSERSIDDQIAACAEFAQRHSLPAPALTFADAAISGASMATRPQLLALLELVRARRVSVIMAEAIDRLSRDQADVHLIRRACEANNVKLYTIADGEVSGMVAGLQGIMAEAFLKNLGDKTRRGMKGVARSGRIAGGLSYGYRAIDGKPGERTIDEAQAAIVRRIFAEYVAHRSPFAIARALNAEHLPGPRGGRWKVATLLGDASVGDGILCNELYRGRIVFNRRRFVKNAETGKRSSFINARTDWVTTDAPHLRIITDDIWSAAQTARQAAATLPIHRRPRAKLLLSGLLTCAACGGAFIIRNRNRFACANVINGSGLCEARSSVPADIVERRVIGGLKNTLLHPEIVAEAVAAFRDERRIMAASETRQRRDAERGLEDATRRASRIADQLIDNPSPTLKLKLAEAEAAMAAFNRELEAMPDASSIVELHPRAPDAYRAQLAKLEAALAADAGPAIRNGVRGLLERVELAPDADAPDGWSVVLHGQLAAILALFNDETPGLSARGSSPRRVQMGAGAHTQLHPTTFRLVA